MGRKRDELPELLKIGSEGFAKGQFDQGALTEDKMIGFSGEGSRIHRLGPLYYWAYGQAHRVGARVPLHPHRGFEIFTYLLSGRLLHQDSLGNRAILEAGGLQVMQTGSGMEHEECFLAAPSSLLQIWLDPDFRKAVEGEARFETFASSQFEPRTRDGKALVWRADSPETHSRHILGRESPVSLQTPGVQMEDVWIKANEEWEGEVGTDSIWAGLILAGRGVFRAEQSLLTVVAGEWLVFQPTIAQNWRLLAEEGLRLIWISVPREPAYGLFPKPRGARARTEGAGS